MSVIVVRPVSLFWIALAFYFGVMAVQSGRAVARLSRDYKRLSPNGGHFHAVTKGERYDSTRETVRELRSLQRSSVWASAGAVLGALLSAFS